MASSISDDPDDVIHRPEPMDFMNDEEEDDPDDVIHIPEPMDFMNDEEGDDRIRRKVMKNIASSWEQLVNIYQQDPSTHKIRITKLRNTALHLAVSSGRQDIVEQLVELVINQNQHNPLEVLSMKNSAGDTPLHLAAAMGDVDICRCIIKGHEYKKLLGVGNNREETPLFMAALYGRKDAFFWLYEMCDSAKVHDYCRNKYRETPLHCAIRGEHYDLALEIINRMEDLVDLVDEDGSSPLQFLAEKPNAFRSGIYLSLFDRIIYDNISVEDLIPGSFEEKIIKISEKPYKHLDSEDPEEGHVTEYHGHNSSYGALKYQQFPANSNGLIKFLLSKALVVVFSLMPGTTVITKLKERKKMHVLSDLIMNKLLEHAVRSEYERNTKEDKITEPKEDMITELEEDEDKSELEEDKDKNEPQGEASELIEDMPTKPKENEACEPCLHSEYGYFQRGKAEEIPILSAAKNGIKEMVEKILEVFPMSIYDKDEEEKNIVLLAVENRQSHVYQFLLNSTKVLGKELAFHAEDEYREKALDLAVKREKNRSQLLPTSLMQMQSEVKWYEYVKNTLLPDFVEHKTSYIFAKDETFQREHRELEDESKKWLNSRSNSCTIIAALIATVAFASSATIPGGVNNTGKPIFEQHLAFRVFAITALIALCYSFISLLIFFTFLITKCQYKDFSNTLPRNLLLGLDTLFISMVAMLICFCSGHFLILEDHLKYAAIPIYVLTCSATIYFFLLQLPLYFLLMKNTFYKAPEQIYEEYL